MQATYHKKKIDVPDEVAKKLRLKDGDKVEYVMQEDDGDSVKLKIERRRSAKDLLLEELKNPKPLGAKSPIRRSDSYE